MTKHKNVFISHFGEDDEHVQKLKKLMNDNGFILRNSSIDSTKPNNASNEEYIKSLLRDGMNWAGTTIVLIGPKTHTRYWVDWEIELANKYGNRIVGVYINGATDSDVPENFNRLGDALVGWRSDKIADAIEGKINNWEKADGTTREDIWQKGGYTC